MMESKMYTPSQCLYNIYKRIADDCPAWWNQENLSQVVDGICAMLARDKYTDKEIAAFWECPVNFVYEVKHIKEQAITKLREEYRECKRIGQAAQNRISVGVWVEEKEAVLALCELILKDYDKIEKEMQK